jgi:hypothetical protein
MVSKIEPGKLRELHLTRHPKTTPKDIYKFINRNKPNQINKETNKSNEIEIFGAKPPKKKKMKLS